MRIYWSPSLFLYCFLIMAMQQPSSPYIPLKRLHNHFSNKRCIKDTHFYDDTSLILVTNLKDASREEHRAKFFKFSVEEEKKLFIKSFPEYVYNSAANEEKIAFSTYNSINLMDIETGSITRSEYFHYPWGSFNLKNLQISKDRYYVGAVGRGEVIVVDIRSPGFLVKKKTPPLTHRVADYTLNQLPRLLFIVYGTTNPALAGHYICQDLLQGPSFKLSTLGNGDPERKVHVHDHQGFNYEGDRIIAREKDTVFLDSSSGALLARFAEKDHPKAIKDVKKNGYCCTKDDSTLITLARSLYAIKSYGKVWDIYRKKVINTFKVKTIPTKEKCSPDGKKLLTGDHDIGDIPLTAERATIIDSFQPHQQYYFKKPLYGNNPADTYDKIMKIWSMKAKKERELKDAFSSREIL